MTKRLSVIATAIAVFILSACGSGGSGTGSGSGNGSGSGSKSPAPSSAASPESWGASAEGVCREVFDTRGSPEKADSENLDDQMAADAYWAANLQDKAASRLAGLPAESSYGAILIDDMKYAHVLNQDMGSIYLEHPVFSSRLDQDRANLAQLQQDIAQLADYLGTPSCYEIAKQSAG